MLYADFLKYLVENESQRDEILGILNMDDLNPKEHLMRVRGLCISAALSPELFHDCESLESIVDGDPFAEAIVTACGLGCDADIQKALKCLCNLDDPFLKGFYISLMEPRNLDVMLEISILKEIIDGDREIDYYSMMDSLRNDRNTLVSCLRAKALITLSVSLEDTCRMIDDSNGIDNPYFVRALYALAIRQICYMVVHGKVPSREMLDKVKSIETCPSEDFIISELDFLAGVALDSIPVLFDYHSVKLLMGLTIESLVSELLDVDPSGFIHCVPMLIDISDEEDVQLYDTVQSDAEWPDPVVEHNFGLFYRWVGDGKLSEDFFKLSSAQGHVPSLKRIGLLNGDSCLEYVCSVLKDVSYDNLMVNVESASGINEVDTDVMFNLGLKYLKGDGVERSLPEALAWFKMAADNGDAGAMHDLGLRYYKGDGVDRSLPEALAWFKMAAEGGHAGAMCDLGIMYLNGYGVGRSLPEALAWFKRAADNGFADAMHNLGLMCYHGYGVDRSLPEALAWFKRAAEGGHAGAMHDLGIMYLNGYGVGRSLPEALAWFKKAADKGNADAMWDLGIMYYKGDGVDRSLPEALAWFKRAAKGGHAGAMYNLGYLYSKGDGVKKSPSEALAWFKKAADKGNADAMHNLGIMYTFGYGTNQSIDDAIHWFTEAASFGDEDAQHNLNCLKERMGSLIHRGDVGAVEKKKPSSLKYDELKEEMHLCHHMSVNCTDISEKLVFCTLTPASIGI